MNYHQAEALLQQRTKLLREIEDLELHCELSSDVIFDRLESRQRIIGQLQQLDAPVREIQRLRSEQWADIDMSVIDSLVEEGREIAGRICACDAQLIENANEKKSEILSGLKRTTLVKGYMPSNRQVKARPPVIVDRNA